PFSEDGGQLVLALRAGSQPAGRVADPGRFPHLTHLGRGVRFQRGGPLPGGVGRLEASVDRIELLEGLPRCLHQHFPSYSAQTTFFLPSSFSSVCMYMTLRLTLTSGSLFCKAAMALAKAGLQKRQGGRSMNKV